VKTQKVKKAKTKQSCVKINSAVELESYVVCQIQLCGLHRIWRSSSLFSAHQTWPCWQTVSHFNSGILFCSLFFFL